MVGVAQLVEPWIVIPVVVGSSPIVHPNLLRIKKTYGPLAQLVEQWTLNPLVIGSIPIRPTTTKVVKVCLMSKFYALFGLIIIGQLVGVSHAQSINSQSCETLNNLDVPGTVLRLSNGGIEITNADFVPASGRAIADNGDVILDLPEHCRVQGEIAPIDSNAPSILFNVNIPVEWNGKTLQSGGGGLGGSRNTSPGRKASGRWDPQPYTDTYPLTNGYATFGGDEGHQGNDISFVYNDEALRNWASDSFIKVRDIAIWLITHAYGRAPDFNYFSGESAGGREAVMMAQRFPDSYDGIIAVTPVIGWTYIHIGDNRIRSKLVDGWLDADDISLIADKTRELCDADDGLVDGIIARYMECQMNPQVLLCPEDGEGEGCLSAAQILALNAIREPWASTVPYAHNINRFPGFGTTGDEDGLDNQYSFYMVGTVPPLVPLPPGRGWQQGLGGILNFGALWVRHVIAQDESFQPHNFYAPAYSDRIQYLSGLFDATDPDLSEFHQHGGKLIVLQQSADNAVSTPMIAEYYRSVVATLGEAITDETLRFYVGPGGSHNGGGVAQADLLGLLESWVEEGISPSGEIPIHDIDPQTLETRRSMVACVYPMYTHYNGTGDINDSDSYSCADRNDPLAYGLE